MTLFKQRLFLSLVLILTGCSSPPEPVTMPWNTSLVSTNKTLPLWLENTYVFPSPFVAGHWSKVIWNFNNNSSWPPDIWYALAHSTTVTVSAPDAEAFFSAKSWLRNHGVKGLILYRMPAPHLLYSSTDIFLTR